VPALVLRGHREGISTVAFSPSNRLIASASGDETVKVWDAKTGNELFTLHGHKGAVRAIAFSPDSLRLASAGEDGSIRIWDVDSHRELARVDGRHGIVHGLAFTSNGTLASAGEDGHVRIWSEDLQTELLNLGGHTGAVRCLAVAADGNLLASGGDDQLIKLHNTLTGEEVRDLIGRTGAVNSVCFGPQGRLVSASADGSIRVWNTHTGQSLITLPGHDGPASSVAFSSDGRWVASASMQQGLKIEDGRPLTPGLAVEREALAVLERLATPSASEASIRARILEAPGIHDALRQRAIELAGSYVQGILRREADNLIHILYSGGANLKPDLVESIRTKKGVSEAVRTEALTQVERFVESPSFLHNFSREMLRRTMQPDSVYRRALQQVETACRLRPDNHDYLVTLGIAHYRAKDYDTAVDTLRRAKRLFTDAAQPPPPALLAFLAMTQYQLGKKEQAQNTLAQLCQRMQQPPWATQDEAKDFLAECKRIVDGK